MDKKILVVTDGSEYSEGAVREAIKIAKSRGSQLYAMSVIEINPQFIKAAPVLLQNIEKETRESLEWIKERAAKEKVACEIIIREGEEPYKLIIEEADKKQVGLIVMGRHGKTRLEKALMGSVTARVIGYSKKDVLVIPMNTQIGWKNILVATDGSKYSDAAVDEAINYARLYKGELKAISVVNVTDEFQALAPSTVDKLIDKAKERLDVVKDKAYKAGLKIETFVKEGEPYEMIVNLAKQLNVDIIVMGRHGRTGLTKIFMGSVTARVIGYTERPVLVVHAA
jgi:hypothetical protein